MDYLEHKRFDSPTSSYANTPGAIARAAIAAIDPNDTPTPAPDPRQFAALDRAVRRLRPEYESAPLSPMRATRGLTRKG